MFFNYMLLTNIGKISSHIDLIGSRSICCYLVNGSEQSVLLDAGMTADAETLSDQIHHQLNDPSRFTWILLTHSHYDHLGGVPFLVTRFPHLKVAAHPHVSEILNKANAVKLIQQLNAGYAEYHRKRNPNIQFTSFQIDRFLSDNELIEIGDVSIQVIYTPGHTRGCISFYVLPDQALFSSDVIGAPTTTGFIQPAFLSDYSKYLNSLYEFTKLEIEVLCLPHGGAIKDSNPAQSYIQKAIEHTISLRERIEKHLSNMDGNIEGVTQEIIEEDYQKHQIKQAIEPYRINIRAMVKTTKKDMFGD